MAIDILEHDHRIIDQPPYSKREPAQRHDIDGRVVHKKSESTGQNGKWNRQENRKGRSETAQENKNHERRQNRTGDRLMLQTGNRLPDVNGLVEDGLQFHSGRKSEDLRQQLLDAIYHRYGIRADLA